MNYFFHDQERAVLSAQPFPHIEFENVLPQKIWSSVIKDWPDNKCFEQPDVYVQNQQNTKWSILCGSETWRDCLENSEGLALLYQRLNSQNFQRKMVSKFLTFLTSFTSLDPKVLEFQVNLSLSECDDNYVCPVHTDR